VTAASGERFAGNSAKSSSSSISVLTSEKATRPWWRTYTPDASSHGAKGRDALAAFAASAPSGFRHLVMKPVIEVTDDTATMQAYLLILRGGALVGVGEHRDELARTPKGWRFAKWVVTIEPPPGPSRHVEDPGLA